MLLTVSKVLFGHLSAGWNPWGSAVSHACPPSVPPCFWRFRRCCLGTSSICSRLGEPSGWNPAGALPFRMLAHHRHLHAFSGFEGAVWASVCSHNSPPLGLESCGGFSFRTRAHHWYLHAFGGFEGAVWAAHLHGFAWLYKSTTLPYPNSCWTHFPIRLLVFDSYSSRGLRWADFRATAGASMGKRTCHDAISNTKLLATMPSGLDISSPNAAVSFCLAIRAFVLLPFGRPAPCLYWVFGACLLLRRWCHAAKGDLCADFRHHGLSPHLAPPFLQEKACSDRRSLAPLLLPTDVTHLRAVLVFFCSPAHVVPEVRFRQPLPACAARPATTHTCLAYAPRRSACRPRSFSECRGIFSFVAYKTLFVRIARYAHAIKCGLGPLVLATVLRRRSPDGTLTALPRLTCVHVPLHAFLTNPSPVASFPLADAELRFTFRCVAFCARFFFL